MSDCKSKYAWLEMFNALNIKQDGFALMIQLGRVLGG